MESQFPGNSQKGSKPGVPPKEVKKVVTGEVVRRKKSLGKRFKETFLGDPTLTTKEVAVDVILSIVIPSIKDMLFDSVSEAFQRKLFGEVRHTSRRGHRPQGAIFGNVNYNPYNRYAHGGSSLRPDPRQDRVPEKRGRVPFSAYDDIVFASRAEATEALDQMIAIIAQYDAVTVSDLFEMAEVTGEFTDDNWGWTDLRGADVQRVPEGYILNLPRPMPIEN